MFSTKSLSLFLLACAVGCAGDDDPWKAKRPKTAPASGIVTLDGVPLEGAQVVLIPSGEGTGGSGLSAMDGTFKLSAYPPDEGMVPGSYKVMVVKANVPEVQEVSEDVYTPPTVATLLVPQKYTDVNSSGLTVEIPESGTTNIKLDLTK